MTRVKGKSPTWKPSQHPSDALHYHYGLWYCAHCHRTFANYPGVV